MTKPQDDLYYKGYIAGYQDGIRDAAAGRNVKMTESDVMGLPIRGMALSVRASNCLSRAGCTNVADVAALSEHSIAVMRNMGTKTASEIARWLDAHGISFSAWSKYL